MPMQPYATGILALGMASLPEQVDVLIAYKTGAIFAGVRRGGHHTHICDELNDEQYRMLTSALTARGIVLNPMQHGLAECARLPGWVNHGLERKIIRRIFEEGIKQGFAWEVNDGGETVVVQSQDIPTLMEAIASTDADYLRLRWPLGTKTGSLGRIMCVYGNGFWEIFADYSAEGKVPDMIDNPEFQAFVDGLEERFA